MALVNGDTLVRDLNGNFQRADALARFFKVAPRPDGKFLIPDSTLIKLPNGATMNAGLVGVTLAPGTSTVTPEPAPAPAPPSAPSPIPVVGETPEEKNKRNQDALATIRGVLDQYGLGSLADWAWPLVQQDFGPTYILQELRNQPAFKARFPGIEARAKAGLPPLSPADYVATEARYDAVLHEAGLTNMFDRNDLYLKWIVGDVSAGEAADRAKAAYQAAMGESLEVRSELVRIFGSDAAGVATAYWLDPTNALPKIQQRLAAGQIAGGAVRSGFSLLTREEAEELSSLGVTGDQAQQGFGDLAQKAPLFISLPGENADTIDRSTQIGAEFKGNAAAQKTIEDRAASRRGQVNAGAAYVVGAKGVGGLGSAKV